MIDTKSSKDAASDKFAHDRLVSALSDSGYFEKTKFIDDAKATNGEMAFFDSNTGKKLFTAPKNRSLEQFLVESRRHGKQSLAKVFVSVSAWVSLFSLKRIVTIFSYQYEQAGQGM